MVQLIYMGLSESECEANAMILDPKQLLTRKHSSRMRTDCTVTRMSSDRVVMRPIVNRMTHASENITLPSFILKYSCVLTRHFHRTD